MSFMSRFLSAPARVLLAAAALYALGGPPVAEAQESKEPPRELGAVIHDVEYGFDIRIPQHLKPGRRNAPWLRRAWEFTNAAGHREVVAIAIFGPDAEPLQAMDFIKSQWGPGGYLPTFERRTPQVITMEKVGPKPRSGRWTIKIQNIRYRIEFASRLMI